MRVYIVVKDYKLKADRGEASIITFDGHRRLYARQLTPLISNKNGTIKEINTNKKSQVRLAVTEADM